MGQDKNAPKTTELPEDFPGSARLRYRTGPTSIELSTDETPVAFDADMDRVLIAITDYDSDFDGRITKTELLDQHREGIQRYLASLTRGIGPIPKTIVMDDILLDDRTLMQWVISRQLNLPEAQITPLMDLMLPGGVEEIHLSDLANLPVGGPIGVTKLDNGKVLVGPVTRA